MRTFEVVCPSGLRGEMRTLTVRDEGLLTQPQLLRRGVLITKFLEACWTKTLDAGPYGSNGATGGLIDWRKVLTTDRFYAFVRLRAESKGSAFEFEARCDRAGCGAEFLAEIDLDALPCRAIPPEDGARIAANEPFEVMVEGKRVRYRLQTGGDDEKLGHAPASQLSALSISQLIVAVEGVADHPGAIGRWVEELDSLEADHLRDELDARHAGLDTRAVLTCTSCGGTETIERLPLTASFFSVRKRTSLAASARSGSPRD